MCIEELTKAAAEFIENSTHEEQVQLLKVANIFDNDGFLHPDYFSDETVKENRENGISFL